MTGDISIIQNLQPYPKNAGVRIADGTLAPIKGVGRVYVNSSLTLFPVLYVPQLRCNLVSVSQITQDLKCAVVFGIGTCEFQEVTSGRTIGKAELSDGLYLLHGMEQEKGMVGARHIMLWHYRLGHTSFVYLERLFPHLFRNKRTLHLNCEVCQYAKHTRSTYSPASYSPTSPFSVIHSDIWGPSRVTTLNGKRWFITMIDEHTRLTWTFLMKDKSETTQVFQDFYAMVETQFQTKIRVLRTDNARDYFNSALGRFLSTHGIVHSSSCVETPEQNGIAERKNRQLLDMARALMFGTHVPKYLWGEALLTATYLVNRLPSRTLKYNTPRQILIQSYPHIHSFSADLSPKVFGCTTFVHLYAHQCSKLDPRSVKCVLVGYSAHKKGYKCYCPHSRKMYHTMDVTFFEAEPYFSATSIQGESVVRDSQLWDIIGDSAPETVMPSSETLVQHVQEPGQIATKNSAIPEDVITAPRPPVKHVYTRRSEQSTAPVIPATEVTEAAEPETATSEVVVIPATEFTEAAEPETATSEVVPTTEAGNADLYLPIAYRKGVRECTKHPINKCVSYSRLNQSYRAFISQLDNEKIPDNIHEAMKSPEWREAVMNELEALKKNNTWTMVKLPSGKRTVDCKWIFSIKYKADGSIERFKARLVARGFTQSYGIDYEETFAPVAKLSTVRVLLSLAVNLDWPLYQLDVKNAFLNGDLAEEVYMKVPAGMSSEKPGFVCKLRKALYGLKQSPRAWFERFTNAVKSGGYKQCQTDHTLFVKHNTGGKISILIVYVDDIIITGDDYTEIADLKKKLAAEFEIKDLGHLKYFLGMEIARSKDCLIVSQRKYVLDLLNETGMLGCKPIDTPMEQNKRWTREAEPTLVERGRYQRLVGKLIYLSHTRPDITFAVGIVSQHMQSPNEDHMEAVYRILRYLKGSPGLGLQFSKKDTRGIEVYTDASWAGELTDRRSTSGYCTFVYGNLVTWRSKKQPVVARSSAEAEYRAVALGICEGIWLKRLLEELKVDNKNPIALKSDSQSAISIVKNPVHHDRTKHVEIDRSFISEKASSGVVEVTYVPSALQTADMLTKATSKDVLERFKSKLGLYNIYTKLEGECRDTVS
ncbi:Copia protein [Linum perenne]